MRCASLGLGQMALGFQPALQCLAELPQLGRRLNLKQEMSKRVPVRTKAKLRQAATEHMSMLEQTPERVIGYFRDRYVEYAA
jgi:hypothetical protein